ncbi:hypothetical protein MSZK_13670 [Mycobacterium sp. shizuoka-1]|nr:hypothetical protein MSZK_13670 [Mycobacterium sp. shizuoka-1]
MCWYTPGIEAISRGSSIPSATNMGNTKCLGSKAVSATRRRSAGVERNLRGRCLGKVTPRP